MKLVLVLLLMIAAALSGGFSLSFEAMPVLGALAAYALFVAAFRIPFGEDDENIIDRLRPGKRFVTAFFAPFMLAVFFTLTGAIVRIMAG